MIINTIIKPISAVKTLKHSFLALSLISSFNLFAQTQVIHAGTLLQVAGEKALSKQTVVITDGIITSIKKGFVSVNEIDKGATLIDLSSSFVMAGLMDMSLASVDFSFIQYNARLRYHILPRVKGH